MSDKVTYLKEIITALEILGGSGSLKEINQVIEDRNILPSIHTNKDWKNNVSAELQRHCRETKSYQGASDLFFSVYGLGEGFWGLKNFVSEDTPKDTIENRICERIESDDSLKKTEKEMLIKARNGQGLFRDRIIKKYRQCIITGISDTRLLIAGHICPWRSSDNENRLSEDNGLLFSPLFDKMFDIGLISFNNKMQMILSSELTEGDIKKIKIDTERVYIHSPSQKLKENMEYHRDMIFKP